MIGTFVKAECFTCSKDYNTGESRLQFRTPIAKAVQLPFTKLGIGFASPAERIEFIDLIDRVRLPKRGSVRKIVIEANADLESRERDQAAGEDSYEDSAHQNWK